MKAGGVVASGPCGAGSAGGAASGAAQAMLAAQGADVVTGLALAALMAGLAPVGGEPVRASTRAHGGATQHDEPY